MLQVLTTSAKLIMVRENEIHSLTEASNAEVGQVIAGTVFASFLTPNMALKNDARHGIVLFRVGITRCHIRHRFLKSCLASKSLQTLYR